MPTPEPPCTPPRCETPTNVDMNEVEHEIQPVNVLWDAFTREMQDPRTLTDSLADQIDGPRQLKDTISGSLHWVLEHESDVPCVLRFPALLDLRGTYGRTGRYFNQERNGRLSFQNFRKMKAIFELERLPSTLDVEGKPVYPPEAVECSKRMFNCLHICTHKLESERNKGLGKNERAVSIGFFGNYLNARKEIIKSSFVVSTPPFFVDIEDPSTVDDLSDEDIEWGSQSMSQFLNNEALTQTFEGKGKAKRSSQSNSEQDLTLDDLVDLNGRYSQLKQEGHGSTKVIMPQIFDKNGDIILPTEYGSKLSHQTPVMVDVQMRVWEFLPDPRKASASPMKQKLQANRNGTRRYQLVLSSMKLLAACAIESPSKRKAEGGTLDSYVGNNRNPPDSPTPVGPKRARR